MTGFRLPSTPAKCSRVKRNHCKAIKSAIMMKSTPIEAGIVAVASPLPLFFCTVFWSWILTFTIGMGILGLEYIPNWLSICSLLPLLVSPIIGVMGLIHSIIKIKEKRSWVGFLLSFLGLAENLLLIYCIGYIGSRF